MGLSYGICLLKEKFIIKKLVSLFVALCSIALNGHSQSFPFLDKFFEDADSMSSITITKNSTVFVWDHGSDIKKDIQASSLYRENGFTYLSAEDGTFVLFFIELSNGINILSLVKNDPKEGEWDKRHVLSYCSATNLAISSAPVLQPVRVVDSSSFLREKWNGKEIEYIPKLYKGAFHLFNVPWVVTENDKEPWIEFQISPQFNDYRSGYLEVTQLVVCNGFFYPGRLDLFKKNARIKEVRIAYGDTDFVAELKDVPGYQIINLPHPIIVNDDIKAKMYVRSMYPGDMYTDIALSALLFPTARLKE